MQDIQGTDTVWAQSRHPEGLQRWHFFCKNPLDEIQLSRPSGTPNSMIFDAFQPEQYRKKDEQKYICQKHDPEILKIKGCFFKFPIDAKHKSMN